MFCQSVEESIVLRAACLAIAILLLLTTKTTAMPKTFHLSLTGEEGTSFDGSCTLQTSENVERLQRAA